MFTGKTLTILLLSILINCVHSKEIIKSDSIEGIIKIAVPEVIEGRYDSNVEHKRSFANIMHTIISNMKSIREYYNLRLREEDAFYGEIKVRFSIDSKGDVFDSKVDTSTVNDSGLEKFVLKKLNEINFGEVENNNEITIAYNLVFDLKPKKEMHPENKTAEKHHRNANTCSGFQPPGFAAFFPAKLHRTSCIRGPVLRYFIGA